MMREKKRGLKLTIIDEFDYEDYREVIDTLLEKGFKAKLIDNGNTVIYRPEEESLTSSEMDELMGTDYSGGKR